MITAILFILLLVVMYVYTTDTFARLFVTLRVTGRLLMILLVVALVFGLILYSFVKYGRVF